MPIHEYATGASAPTPTLVRVPHTPPATFRSGHMGDYICRHCGSSEYSAGVPHGWFRLQMIVNTPAKYEKPSRGIYCSLECVADGADVLAEAESH